MLFESSPHLFCVCSVFIPSEPDRWFAVAVMGQFTISIEACWEGSCVFFDGLLTSLKGRGLTCMAYGADHFSSGDQEIEG